MILKITISRTGKSGKNHSNKKGKNKCLIDELLEKFNHALSIPIIRNNEAFLLDHILSFLKKL